MRTHLTGRPREAPVRVALAAAMLTFMAVLLVAGSQELVVQWSGWPVSAVRNALRVLVFVLPVAVGLLAGWVATALRGSDRRQHDRARPPGGGRRAAAARRGARG